MVGDTKAMCFITNALEQMKPRRVARKAEGLGMPRNKDFLFALGERNQFYALDAHFGKYLFGGVQLSFAAVDDDKVGHARPGFVVFAFGGVDALAEWNLGFLFFGL